MVKILAVNARQILDSRGNPTVECDIKTALGVSRASVPSGASTGSHEAVELRDNGKNFFGQGVMKAVENINKKIGPALKGKDPADQKEIDKILLHLDGTANKSKLGANALLAASMAASRAGALAEGVPLYEHIACLFGTKKVTLPVPAFNIINGGKHAGNKIDVQEYMVMPVGAKNFSEALQIGSEVYHALKQKLLNDFGKSAINVGDEGGFAPPYTCIEEPLEAISAVIDKLGYAKKAKLGMDCAASTFWKGGKYYLEGKEHTADQLRNLYEDLVKNYPLISIEDPFMEEDFEHFSELKRWTEVQVVGDDLLCTNPKRINAAIAKRSCNCLLLKVNQIGTLTEAFKAASLAYSDKWNVMVSHRSGETEDNFIADLSVGIASQFIKAGAPCRGERLAKYNQLLRIEEETKAPYAGKHFRIP